MRSVARLATFGLYWSVFINKGPLLVSMAFHAGSISASSESSLSDFKATVSVMAISALHGAFQHLVPERLVELVLGFCVAGYTQLRFSKFEQAHFRGARFFSIRRGDEDV